ncbi:MAG: hypothetical protein U0Q18_16320 [Bryobacteraceae bacterium]
MARTCNCIITAKGWERTVTAGAVLSSASMASGESTIPAIRAALRRARQPILWVGLAQILGVITGAVMVHSHNGFALHYADQLIGRASSSGPIADAMHTRRPVRAALIDFAGNLGVSAIPSTVMGLSVVLPLPVAAYRGWIGGIVSVDWHHESRLRPGPERTYYLIVMLMQIIPYTLATAAGIRLGLAFVSPNGPYGYANGKRWAGLPAEGVRDVLRIYAIAVPLFLAASLVEFLAR